MLLKRGNVPCNYCICVLWVVVFVIHLGKGVFSSLCGYSAPHILCFPGHVVTECNDHTYVLNKPAIVWWACTGMSHSSNVESLLLPDEFPNRCFTNKGHHHHHPLPPLLLPALCWAKHPQREANFPEAEMEEWRWCFQCIKNRKDKCVWEMRRITFTRSRKVFKRPLTCRADILPDPSMCWNTKVEPK